MPTDIPEVTITATDSEMPLMKVIKEAGLVPSSAEAGRNIDQGGVHVNGEKVTERVKN